MKRNLSAPLAICLLSITLPAFADDTSDLSSLKSASSDLQRNVDNLNRQTADFLKLSRELRSKDSADLRLAPGTTADKAIDAATFSTPNRWKFDCFEFAEVIQLYALGESLGHNEKGAQQFNQTVKRAFTSARNPGGVLEIRP